VSLEHASTANPPSLFSLVRQVSAATWQALAGKSRGIAATEHELSLDPPIR
jgi:hypothetical protein